MCMAVPCNQQSKDSPIKDHTVSITSFKKKKLSYILFMLLQLSQFFSLCSLYPVPPPFPPLQAIPTLLSMSMGHAYMFFGYCIPYAVLYTPMTICNSQFVLLNPFTFMAYPPKPFTSGNHQNVLCIQDSVSVLLVCSFCFLDSIVDR